MGREETRKFFLLGGALAGVVLVALLSLIFEKDSLPAELLLDHVSSEQVFPFPFTIQSVLWVVFGVGVGDLVHRRLYTRRQARALALGLLPEDERTMLVAQDMPEVVDRLDRAGQEGAYFLCDIVRESVHHFQANRSADQAHSLIGTMIDMELHRVDLRYTLGRYFAWLLPTLGFIGTVVGIAGALMALREGGGGAQADLEPVVSNLATAFNTTILALILSAILVVVLQFTQKSEEETVNATSAYCVRNFVNRLFVPPDAAR